MKKSTITLLVVVGILVALASWVIGAYNGLVTLDEETNGKWAQVESAYQRRADLIPNLVNTVKGYAEFEQETLTGVIEARAQIILALKPLQTFKPHRVSSADHYLAC